MRAKKHPVPILEARKRHPVPKLEAQKGTLLSSGTSPVLPSMVVPPPPPPGCLWMNGLLCVLIEMCDIVPIPSLYSQLQFMSVAPPVVAITMSGLL